MQVLREVLNQMKTTMNTDVAWRHFARITEETAVHAKKIKPQTHEVYDTTFSLRMALFWWPFPPRKESRVGGCIKI
jgi:hypothetical protein